MRENFQYILILQFRISNDLTLDLTLFVLLTPHPDILGLRLVFSLFPNHKFGVYITKAKDNAPQQPQH